MMMTTTTKARFSLSLSLFLSHPQNTNTHNNLARSHDEDTVGRGGDVSGCGVTMLCIANGNVVFGRRDLLVGGVANR